jgi:hypothetical protein
MGHSVPPVPGANVLKALGADGKAETIGARQLSKS